MGNTSSTINTPVNVGKSPDPMTSKENQPPPPTKPSNHPDSSMNLSAYCPVVKKSKDIKEDKAPPESSKTDTSSSCPVKYKNSSVYNVYSQKIDPKNNMPSQANNQPAPNQEMPLSVERVPSTIPKGGTDSETWLYPSPQMFWNALVRKQKTEDASEEYMDTVVAIHNNMNENTWKQVLAWEELHHHDTSSSHIIGAEPKLLRFTGRPDELSPKARLKTLLGNPAPFDRHDWTVDRGGKEIRYVIDYYHDDDGVQYDQKPKNLNDTKSLQSIKVDVRPALDSVEAVVDRVIMMPWLKLQGKSSYNPPSFFPSYRNNTIISSPPPSSSHGDDMIKDTMMKIQSRCTDHKLALKNCKSDVECAGASMNLQRCAASVICPEIVRDFDIILKNSSSSNVNNDDSDKIDASFMRISSCLDDFQAKTHL